MIGVERKKIRIPNIFGVTNRVRVGSSSKISNTIPYKGFTSAKVSKFSDKSCISLKTHRTD